jgi:hypothetical protein
MFKHGIKYKTDKVTHHGYDRFYDYFLIPYKNTNFTLFEIGIDAGRSLRMWLDMYPQAKIYGMDINQEYMYKNGGIFKGDQSSKEDLDFAIKEIKKANIIIDDGSHKPEHQLFTFNYLFDKLLEFGGTYIIEDIETNYWRKGELYDYNIEAGFNAKNNIVNIFKNIVDIVNREYLLPEHIEFIKNNSKIDFVNLKYISFIMFGHNCIIIKKMTHKEYEKYGNRKYRFGEYL